MLNLGGLSAAYPGYQAAEATQATTETNQAAAKEAALKLLGQHVLGRALTGAQPDQGPQPPAPGQPSAPSAPQGGGPAGPGAIPNQMQQAPPAPPQAAPAVSAAPSAAQGTPEITLQALTQRILATSPRVKDHPEVLMAALERAAPLLDRQSKEDLAELRKEMSTQRLKSAAEIAKARQDSLDTWRGQQGNRADRRLDQRDDAQESLVDYRKRTGDQRDAEEIGRNGRHQAAEAGKKERFDTSEARRTQFAASREGRALAELDLKRQALEQRIESAKTREDRERLALELRTNHQKATEIIQASNAITGMPEEDRKPFLTQRGQQIEDAITRLRTGNSGKSSQPAGASPAASAPAAAPVPAASAPAAAPTVQPPPVAMLKPGGINVINGVGWRLVNGQPVQVPIPGQ
jgi:hypothetical protein